MTSRTAATASLSLLLLTTACGQVGGLRDEGAAPAISPPPTPIPVWPGSTIAPPRTGTNQTTTTPAATPSPPIPGIPPLPDGDIRKTDAAEILRADPSAHDLVTTPNSKVRPPVYRDLTGDGHADLIAAVDTPEESGVFVYKPQGAAVVPIFWYTGTLFTVDTVGHDLLIRQGFPAKGDAQCCPSLLDVTRYRWDGSELSIAGNEMKLRTP